MIALFANKQRRRRRKCRSPPRNTTGQHSLLIPGCADITHARSVDTLLAHPLPKAGEVGPSRAASVSSHRTKIAHLHGQESSLHPHSGVWAPDLAFFFFFQSISFEIYLLAVLGLRRWARAFSSCREQGLLNRGVPASRCGGSPRCTAHASVPVALVLQVGKLSRGGTWAWLPRGT